jgi:hypothetical protein
VSVEDDEPSGRPCTSKTTENVDKFWKLIHEDRCRTIHELADTIGISYGVCQVILAENVNMCRTAMKFVPWHLKDDQKQRHINVCLELREMASSAPAFISRIIMVDESWIYGYDLETKQQSSQWKSPQSPRAKECSKFGVQQRACSLFFLDLKWRDSEVVLPNTTVNSDFYSDGLRR